MQHLEVSGAVRYIYIYICHQTTKSYTNLHFALEYKFRSDYQCNFFLTMWNCRGSEDSY